MARYKPAKEFNTPLLLYVVTGTETVLGVKKKVHSPTGIPFYGSFATYGGTEREVNGIVSVEDTATVETWYRPEFEASARVALADSPGIVYEIVGTPENIERRNIYSKFKLTRVTGGA